MAVEGGDREAELRIVVEGRSANAIALACAAICDWDGVKAEKLGPTARRSVHTHTHKKQCSTTPGGQVEYVEASA